MRALFLFVVTLALTACATQVSQEKIASADYGTPPPANAEQIIKRHFDLKLVDGGSARYRIGAPAKSYLKESPLFGTHETFGYRQCGLVNAKNRMGGYTGYSPFAVFWRNGQIVFSLIPGPDESLNQAAVKALCERTA